MCATSGRNQYAQSPFSFTVEVRDVLFRSGGLTMKEAVNFFSNNLSSRILQMAV